MIKVSGQDIIYVTLEQLTSSIDTLKTTNYHEVEEYRDNLNHLDVVRLAASSLIQTDTVRAIGSSDNLTKYKMEMSKLMQFTCLICIWEDMICVLLRYTTDMRISSESQKQCYKSLRDMLKYSLNDTQLFSVMFRNLEYILVRIDTPAQNSIVSDESELVGELGKRWNINGGCSFESISNNMQYWNYNNDMKKLKLALQREKRVLSVEQLAIKCYTFWRQLIQTSIGDNGSIAISFQIGDSLIFLQRVSCDLVRGIEVVFRIILCLENERLNSVEKSVYDVIDSAFVLIEIVNRVLKKKSIMPNKIIEFVWLILAIEPNQQLLRTIHDLLHKVVPKFVKRELGFNSGNILEELIDSILFYCTRCLQQGRMDICNEVTSLYESIIDMSNNSLHCTFISECFKLAAFSMRSAIHNSMGILDVITKFTNTLFQPSDRYKSTTIKLLANLCIEICLVGENPVSYLQLLLDVIAPMELYTYSQGLTRLVRDFIKAITIKLNRNCISIHDTIRILVPSVSQIVNQFYRIEKITRTLLTVECCTKLITHVSSIHDFEILLYHGLLLIQHVMPVELTIKKASCFFKKLINRFLNRKDTYLLQLADITYEKFIKQFQMEHVEINTLFYYLLTEAPLAKISHIYHACQNPILENKRLSGLHSIFYIQAIEPVILKIFADISTALCFMQNNKYHSLSYPMEDLTYSCVDQILEVIQAEQTDIHIWNHLYERVMLVSFIFIGTADAELDNSNLYKQDLLHLLDVDMPMQLRQLIVTIMKRIIYLDMSVYSPLQSKLAQLMVNSMYFNKNTQKKSENANFQFNMVNVLESIQENLLADTFNQNTIKELISSGYSSKLFKYNIQQQAQTYTHHIATNESQNTFLLSQYREFQHIIKTLYTGVYWFSHNKVYVYDLFKGELSPELFQDRLRYAKMYLFKFVNKGQKSSQHFKAIHALEQERSYKHNLKSKTIIKSRHTLTITLLTQFYHTLISSSDTIDHSIRPLGAHNEIPLEIAIRQDRGIVSIRDSYSNKEVEICEVIFMSEGMYVMESQTNGEGINTTQVWCQLFAKLLTTDHLVPSIILPKGSPNMNTWAYVNKSAHRESINSNLTWSPYYSYEWITYYSTVPNKVHAMEDIVLHPGYKVYTGGLAQRMTPVWRTRTDLVGILFRHVITTLSQKYLTSAYCNYSDYIYSFLKDFLTEPDNQKCNISNTDLEGEIVTIVNKWILSVDIEKLFETDSISFFELKYFLDAHSANGIKKYKYVRADMKIRILESFHTFVLNDLPFDVQKASMLWIEQVDDNLWQETERLEEPFRHLLNQTEQGLKFFPGVVSFFLPQYRDRSSIPITVDVLSPDKISGYVVGKVIELNLSCDELKNDRTRNTQLDGQSVETFEVWGSWVGPKYRRLGIAIDLYRYTFRVLPTHYLTVDMNEGVQWKCAVNAKTGCFFIWLGIVDYIMENIVAKEVPSRWNFYLGGADRNFQRYLINNKFMKPFVYLDTAMNYCNKRCARWRRKKPVKFIYIWTITVILVLLLLLIM